MPGSDPLGRDVRREGSGRPQTLPPPPAPALSQPMSKTLQVVMPNIYEEHLCLITKPPSNNYVND